MRDYIFDTVGRFIELEQGGMYLTALCPFHTELTPSFVVNEEKNYFHCFGCDAHGHVEEFEQAFHASKKPHRQAA